MKRQILAASAVLVLAGCSTAAKTASATSAPATPSTSATAALTAKPVALGAKVASGGSYCDSSVATWSGGTGDIGAGPNGDVSAVIYEPGPSSGVVEALDSTGKIVGSKYFTIATGMSAATAIILIDPTNVGQVSVTFTAGGTTSGTCVLPKTTS